MDNDTNTEKVIFTPAHWELHPTPKGQQYPYLLLHACGVGECYECTISIPQEVYDSMVEHGVRVSLPGMVDADPIYTPELLEEKGDEHTPF